MRERKKGVIVSDITAQEQYGRGVRLVGTTVSRTGSFL